VRQGDDRLLVAAADHQAVVFGAEHGFGSPRGIRGLRLARWVLIKRASGLRRLAGRGVSEDKAI